MELASRMRVVARATAASGSKSASRRAERDMPTDGHRPYRADAASLARHRRGNGIDGDAAWQTALAAITSCRVGGLARGGLMDCLHARMAAQRQLRASWTEFVRSATLHKSAGGSPAAEPAVVPREKERELSLSIARRINRATVAVMTAASATGSDVRRRRR